ncbi:MAG TPA: chemotaxis protein MotB, partial [Syntrophomonas sp.]|nr:chemotaxis protein MotB [Syntrophomonas sp.]
TGQAMSVLDTQGPSLIEGLSGQDMPQNQDRTEQGQLEEVKKLVSEFIEAKDQEARQGATSSQAIRLSEHIIVYEQERGLVISFKDALLFPSGSDQLTSPAREIIAEVGKTLVSLPNYIRVEGHTDNLPINTSRFASNWELSVMRAATVVHVLSESARIPAERLAIIGYGEYRPLVPNENDTYRAMNRRVDIVILKKKYDYFEPPRMNETAPAEAQTT